MTPPVSCGVTHVFRCKLYPFYVSFKDTFCWFSVWPSNQSEISGKIGVDTQNGNVFLE